MWVNVFTCDVCEEWSNCGVYWTVGEDEDDMLAVILGHEMAHAIMGHMVRQVSIKSLAYVFMHARTHAHTYTHTCPVLSCSKATVKRSHLPPRARQQVC